MKHIELAVDVLPPESQLIVLVEGLASTEGLIVSLRGTLRSYAGSWHWHLQQPGQRGTLEITFWPAQQRLWLSIHENRQADWVTDAAEKLKTRLEMQLRQSGNGQEHDQT